MQVVTLRLDEEFVTDLDAEATERGFSNRTEYVRYLLRNRAGTSENTAEHTTDYERIRGRLEGREGRIAALEGRSPRSQGIG